MLTRLLIAFCLCCVVLCAFVGFLSKRAIDEAVQISTQPLELNCGGLIDELPKTSTGVLLRDFSFVDRIATIDSDRDGKWDEVAIPLFSRESFKSKACYFAVIACFRDVPDLETLHERLAAEELQVNFRVNDQELSPSIHTQLATKFKSMDFRHCPVVTVGYGQKNPVLGEASLKLSYTIGAAALGIAVLAAICLVVVGLFKRVAVALRKPSKKRVRKPTRKPRRNRAALSSSRIEFENEPTGGVLDRARSMRNQKIPE